MNGLVMPGVSPAFANFGRWVASCGYALYCDSAAELQRFQDGFICECGRATTVVWPSEDMVSGVERLLTLRPNPKNRNWEPGETLTDLMLENSAHGVFAPILAGIPDRPGTILLGVEEGRIVTDALPELSQGGWTKSLGSRQ